MCSLGEQSSTDAPVKRPIFAVVIGINEYVSSCYDNLCAAAQDADRFNNYLTQNLGVPSNNIHNLRNKKASRDAIIGSILWLTHHAEIKKDEAAIIIYFAGHGAFKNKGIKDIQMICPSDIGAAIPVGNGHNKLVKGLSRVELAELFMNLSKTKGDNITIYLDCCHSTGMIQPRMSTSDGPVVFVEDLERYTIITASGRDVEAIESCSGRSGAFTTQLLKVLTSSDTNCLTYMSLLHHLTYRMSAENNEQMPHGEGSRLYHQLYNLDPSIVGDPSLVPTRCSENRSLITLFAGSVHGIIKGDKLSAYANNLADASRNPCLGKLVADSVDEFVSTLIIDSAMDLANTLPSLFYCKIVDSSMRQSTVLYSLDRSWLNSIFPRHIQFQLSLNIVDDNKNYDLRLDVVDEQVHFRQRTNLVTTDMPDWTTDKSDIDKIHKVVKRYIHFYSHLELISPHNIEEIGIELNELTQTGEKDFVPSNPPRILSEDPIYISASDTKLYGLTLRNNGDLKLYPYIFFFDPMNLTIRALYQPPGTVGEQSTNRTDSPLMPSSNFTIGYGPTVLQRKRFGLALLRGQKVAIAHLKVYLSSCPASFESMIRKTAPFSDSNERAIFFDDELPDRWWMAKTTTFVIQDL